MRKKLGKIRCKIFGHRWRYNFKSIPSKAICSECFQKSKLNIFNLEWFLVNEFDGDSRSDTELIKKWVP